MNAVNLIPRELRSGYGGPGRSGVAPYLMLGALALLLAIVSAYALTTRSVTTKRDELAQLRIEQNAAQATAASLKAYTTFTQLRQKRVETVKEIAALRFDWAHAMHEVARVLPDDAWLTSLRATTAPDVSAQGGASDPLRGAVAAPAIEVTGCAKSQSDVARTLTALRQIDGAQRVSLSSSRTTAQTTSTAPGAAQESAGSSTAGGACDPHPDRYPQFSLTIFYAAPSSATNAPKDTAAGANATSPAPAGTAGSSPAPTGAPQ